MDKIPWSPNGESPYEPPRRTTHDVLSMDAEIVALTEETEGEITPEIQAKIDELEWAAEDLLERLYHAHAAESTRAEFLTKRVQITRELARKHAANARRIENLTRLIMDRRGTKVLELSDGEIRPGRWRVEATELADVTALPEKYLRQPPQPALPAKEADKKAIGKALEIGELVPGYRRVQGVHYV